MNSNKIPFQQIPSYIFYKIISLFNIIKEALIGSQSIDFTQIKLRRAIFLLAIPMVLEMVMESVFAVVDIYFVSKLGADAIATVGITESVITIVYSIAFGLSMATTALVARRIGEKRPRRAAHISWQAIMVGVFISVLIAVPGIIFSEQLLLAMGASNKLVIEFNSYTTIMLGTNMVIMLLFINNAVFRGAGDASISLRVLVIANSLNIFLDPMLILGVGPFPHLGIAGAAWATTIGRGTAVIYQFYILFKGSGRIKLVTSNLKIDLKRILKMLRISMGGILQSIIATSSWIGLVRLIATFGSDAVAGYTVAIRIIIFALLPSWGLSNAASTLVGQNLGARNPQRAEKSVWYAAKINVLFLSVLSIFFIIMPADFIKLFTTDTEVVNVGARCLRIVSFGFILYGLGMVLVQAFNGAGDTNTPMRINILAFWLIELPIAYIMANVLNMNENGIFWSIIIAEAFMTLFALYLFRKGRWKKNEV